MFWTKKYDDEGIIAIKSFIRGKPSNITIDDFLPFDEHTGTLIYT
jgi:hypothetical protein